MKIRYYIINLIKNKKLNIIKLLHLKKDRILDRLAGVFDLGGWGRARGVLLLVGLNGFSWEKVNILRGIFVSSNYIVLCLILVF